MLLWPILVGAGLLVSGSASANIGAVDNNIGIDDFREFSESYLKAKRRGQEGMEPDRELAKKVVNQQIDKNETATIGLKASEFTFSACEKLDLALEFMTSLDFQEHFEKVLAYSNPYDAKILVESESEIYGDIYILQLIFTPIFLALLLFGANLFLHTFVICAALFGLFGVFNGVERLLPTPLDCPMKLALSVIASVLCALMAASCFRVGLFALGSLAFGGAIYVVFDAFPQLDPGPIIFAPKNAADTTELTMPTSDLSTAAMVTTFFFSMIGGVVLRYFEMAQLEIMTAGVGGVGCAYSLHTMSLVQGWVIDPSLVVLLAFFISLGGWKFQRNRRHIGVLAQQYSLTGGEAIHWHPIEQQKQLEDSMMSLLKTERDQNEKHDKISSEKISQLTLSINRLMDSMEAGEKKKLRVV